MTGIRKQNRTPGVDEQPGRLLLQMKNIHVEYQNVHALNGVDFDLYAGEVHALVGEHRAGKSSLVKLLSGALQKTAGEINYLGREVRSFTPESSLRAGIGMIYQDLSVLPSLNAVENVFAGRMIRRPVRGLDFIHMISKAQELFERLNLNLDLDAPLYQLTQAEQLMVEFARIVLLDPRVIILDELSNKLTPREMGTIYDIIMEYRARGKGIIYITHDAEETLRIADRVTILRNGYRRGTEQIADLDEYRLFQLTYSFELSKRGFEGNKMQFYLLKRYTENLTRHLPIGIIILDTSDVIRHVQLGSVTGGVEHAADAGFSNTDIRKLLETVGVPSADELLDQIERREERSWDEVAIGGDQLVRIDVFPFRDDEDEFVGTVILLQDVSIDRYMKDYIVRAEKMATLAEVAAGVAHEINNPLFIIRNYVEVLKDRQLAADELEKLSKIDRELSRIDEIIGSLLSFSRLKERPSRKIDLVEIIDDAILLLQHNISRKHIRLERDIREPHLPIDGDENRLKQLFLNLVINGIDAVLDGGLIRVGITATPDGDAVEVTVADNGYGIPADVQAKVFNPFFTTKVNKKNTGLGLSICQQIAQDHGGDISFSSVPGEFTIFKITLPFEHP